MDQETRTVALDTRPRVPAELWLVPVFAATWIAIWTLAFEPFGVARDFGHFALLGLTGAIVANSTGAGGGVVFMPFFNAAGITTTGALATSLLIQCFGMTAGSLSWLRALKRGIHGPEAWPLARSVIGWSAVPSVCGMWLGQFVFTVTPDAIMPAFKGFSIVLGVLLLTVTLVCARRPPSRVGLNRVDRGSVVLVSLVGGLVTSWISVGVGEFLALALILRGYPVMPAVASAVCVSAITVVAGAPLHALILHSVVWEIVLFAAPAAILGGIVARFLSQRLGPQRLKVFFSAWILITGIAMG